MTVAQPAGPLGRRLLAAFLLVALSSVAVLTVAALVATDRGLASAQLRRTPAGGGPGGHRGRATPTPGRRLGRADLAAASALADAAGARLVVRDADGTMVWPGRARAR